MAHPADRHDLIRVRGAREIDGEALLAGDDLGQVEGEAERRVEIGRGGGRELGAAGRAQGLELIVEDPHPPAERLAEAHLLVLGDAQHELAPRRQLGEIGRASCRERV